MTSPFPSALLDRVLEQTELRAKSMIVTVFGDVVLPRGGSTWLGSVIRILEPLGIGDRVVRTAVFRLTQDGTLAGSQKGRRSYYALTESGRSAFEQAEARIYAATAPQWEGDWTLVILTGGLSFGSRDAVRRDLGWMGFAGLSPWSWRGRAPTPPGRSRQSGTMTRPIMPLSSPPGRTRRMRCPRCERLCPMHGRLRRWPGSTRSS